MLLEKAAQFFCAKKKGLSAKKGEFVEVMQKLCYNLQDQNLKGNKFV
ncbi:MAG: hypothetical protein IJ968_02230 [Clostridia bacterium]|nr:hypothetical protein [Clostridia bacterium]